MRILNFVIVGLFLWTTPARALEADQYRLWKAGLNSIQDSTQITNDFLNQELKLYLNQKSVLKNRINTPEACLDVAYGYMQHIRPNFFRDKLKKLLAEDIDGVAHPAKQKLFYDYKNSIFKGLAWPFLMPVAQTVKINGVFLGTDKIDHFFASGRRYLNAYRRDLAKGLSSQEALIRALRYGVSWAEERGVLGRWSAGSFSFADLEANFQGLTLGLDFCAPQDPIVRYDENQGWIVNRAIRIEDYVSPFWDESFNNSSYLKSRFKKVTQNVQNEYCALAMKPEIKKLWQSYHDRLNQKPAPWHLMYLRGLMLTGDIPRPREQSINHMCGFKDGVMEGPALWKLPELSWP